MAERAVGHGGKIFTFIKYFSARNEISLQDSDGDNFKRRRW